MMEFRRCFLIRLFIVSIITLSSLDLSASVKFKNLLKKHGSLGEPSGFENFTFPPDQWFHQKLDHFNAANAVYWKQRYNTNASFYKPGGPVFLMIGGEGERSLKWMVSGAWINYAKEYNALCFQLEHRFYGQSHPTRNMSVENLEFLNSEQALADLAWFIQSMNNKLKLPYKTKWIAFGGSYPGSLAAWLRYKYPHLVYASVSSSGPLVAKADFTEYFEVVKANLIKVGGYPCVDAISQANNIIYNKFKNETERPSLTSPLKLCDPVENNWKDVTNLFQTLADNVAEIVQYNKDNRGTSRNLTIDTLCGIMTDTSVGCPFMRYAKLNKFVLKANHLKCLDYKYDKMIKSLKDVDWNGPAVEAGRSWLYQTCTEFGFFQTSNNPQDLFGSNFPLPFFQEMCSDIFGSRFDDDLLSHGIDQTNTIYGALSLVVDRTVFIHGTVDPWHALGMTKKTYPGAKIIIIEGTAHCANMYPETDEDLPQLKKAREEIKALIGSWLEETDDRTHTENLL